MSRSELYSNAVKKFIEPNKSANITRLLNEVYDDNESGSDEVLLMIQKNSLDFDKEEW